MSENDEITLAIESAIAGGSVSLLRGDVEIANWVGTSSVSKAEDLLFNIDILLKENGIDRRQISSIAVSAGPGSFTGIRIGIATALGLKAGLGIEMWSESALRAMAFSAGSEGTLTAALPVGRDAICLQSFGAGSCTPIDEPHTLSEVDLSELISGNSSTKFLVHERLYEKMNERPNLVNFGFGLATAIGRVCRADRSVRTPLFISKSF